MRPLLLVLLHCLCSMAAPVHAAPEQPADNVQPDTAQVDTLAPFHVQYRLYVSKIPTTIKADLWLRATEQPDAYEMEMLVKSFLITNRETSQFTWNNCQPRSHHYVHEFRGFGRRRNYDMQFSWDPPRVDSQYKGKQHQFGIEEDTLDELTLLLRARCVLSKGDKEFNATTAYGKKIRKHHMQVVGRETLDTPVGDVDCLVIEKKRDNDSDRRTLFWVAPSLNYMLVKAKHIENRALFGELILRDLKTGPHAADDFDISSDD